MPTMIQRRLPVGAEACAHAGVHFRVWAPRRKRVEAVFSNGRSIPLRTEADGYFSGTDEIAKDRTLYRFRLDGESRLFPDPASRFQPEGPHGPSQVVDASRFRWSDR